MRQNCWGFPRLTRGDLGRDGNREREFKLNEMQMRCSKRSRRRRRNPSISLSVLLLLCYTLHGRCLSQRMPFSLYRPPPSSATGLFRSPPPHSPLPFPTPLGFSVRAALEGERRQGTDGRRSTFSSLLLRSIPGHSATNTTTTSRLSSSPRPRASLLRQCSSPLPPTKVLCVFFPRSYGGKGVATMLHMAACV